MYNLLSMAQCLLLLTLLVIRLLPTSDSASDALQSPANTNCVCPNALLTFTCLINGGGTTLWTGTAFSCDSSEILLRHSQFSEPAGTSGSCNNGAITGRSIGVTNGCYSSELTVTISPNLSGRTILCNYDSNAGPIARNIGSSTLNVLTALDPPGSVQLMDIQNGQAMIGWTPVDSCAPVQYTISSNCSTCSPTTTNLTTSSCPLSEPSADDNIVCTFSIQSAVCDGLIGNSSTLVVALQTPSVNVIPFYFANNKSLSKISIRGNSLNVASDDTTIFITEYNVTYSDPATGSTRESVIVTTCGKNSCENDIEPPLVCPSTITVSAYNGFRQKPLSEPITIECTNRFVDVNYNSTTSTITCTFLSTDTSIKSCQVTYGECDQTQEQAKLNAVQGNSTSESPNTVTLNITFIGRSLCYAATASNGNFTLAVEGSAQSMEAGNNSATVIIVVVVLVTFVVAVIATVSILTCVLYIQRRSKTSGAHTFHKMKQFNSVIRRIKLQPIDSTKRSFTKHIVTQDCNLRDAVVSQMKRGAFERGLAYYEFVNKIENISMDKELIFMEESTGAYFTPTANSNVLKQCGLLGDGVKQQSFVDDGYRLFVQSTGSGARYLSRDSILLYEDTQGKKWNPEDTPLVPLVSNHFMVSEVTRQCTLEGFHKEMHVATKTFNTFLEYHCVSESDIDPHKIRDVILMDKDNKHTLFTGPAARSDLKSHKENWRVFIMLTNPFNGTIPLTAGTLIIHQNPKYIKDKFHVLNVDKDNVKMSDFIENTLGVNFENGRAFYEFTQVDEDLLSYKEVVRMNISQVREHKGKKQQGNDTNIKELETSVKLFYWIPGAPSIGTNPPNFEHYGVFVQSMSQGSRCLKSDTLLLFKVENLPENLHSDI